MRRTRFLWFILGINVSLVAQVTFSVFPRQLQLYGRTATADTGVVAVATILAANAVSLPPDSVVTMTRGRVTSLLLHGRNLSVLPPEIGLDSLAWIALGSNRLSTLPYEIMKLPVLSGIDIDGNRLCGIPDSLAGWIDRIAADTAWKSTRMIDSTHYCDGVNVRSGGHRADRLPVADSRMDRGHVVVHTVPAARIRILRVDGKTVVQRDVSAGSGVLHLRALGRGVYIVEVRAGRLTAAKMMVVQ